MVDMDYIKHVTQILVKESSPEKVYLFGSCARGEQNDDSDIDLLIVKESANPRNKRAMELRRLLFPYKYPMDLLVYTPDEFRKEEKIMGTIPYQVLREGIVLYE